MRLADFWVFLNIILALLISIPAINLFTHGTHITVAHSMGTTIGINTLILLSSVTYILESNQYSFSVSKIRFGIRLFQTSFILFWCCLLLMGVQKANWTFFNQALSFSQFQDAMHWFYLLFVLFGLGIFIGLYRIVFELLNGLRQSFK
jgi:nitric oxide reductase subunit B